jgi:hypothetical protein
MGLGPSGILIDPVTDPRNPFDYVVYYRWYGSLNVGKQVSLHDMRDYCHRVLGSIGTNWDDPWYYSDHTNRLYLKKKDLAFFILTFGFVDMMIDFGNYTG